MWTWKSWSSLRRRCWAGLLVSLWLLLSVSSCTYASAQEAKYEISETELAQLEENLSELSSVNSEQREKLTSLQEMLSSSETRLKLSETTSAMLSARLELLSKELTAQKSSLESANRLLQEFEQEERRTKSRLKRQRNIGYVLAAIAVIFCVTK